MKRKAATRITVIVVSLGAIGLGLLKSIPYLIDANAIKLEIEDGLHKSTGVNFKIRELALEPTVFHGIQVHLNTSTITDMKHHPLGSIDNITVQIRYLPILTQQLPEIAKIHLNHVVIPVGRYNFFKELHLKLVKPKRTGFLKPAEMRNTEILLTDYLIEDTVLDNQIARLMPKAQAFAVRGRKVSIRHLESKQPVSVLGDGLLAFIPENAWPNEPAFAKKGTKPSKADRRQTVNYQVMVELPQAALKKGKFSASGLGKFALHLKGGGLDTDLRYHRQKDIPGQPPQGEGSLRSPSLDLLRGQALVMQIGDTFGLPLPTELGQLRLMGWSALDNKFRIRFPEPSQPVLDLANGQVTLTQVALGPVKQPKQPWVWGLGGIIHLNGKQISTEQLRMALAGLPVTLKGWYQLDSQRLGAQITASSLRISSLKDTLATYGVSTQALEGRNLQGLVDFNANVTGTAAKPAYQGYLALRNARLEDATQGFVADKLNGRVEFKGSGLKNPQVQYRGNLKVNDGLLVDAKQGLNVQHFDGNVDFNGRYQPGPKIEMPSYTGQVNVRQAEYEDPNTGILVSGIQGLIRLGGDWIRAENFQGLLAGSTYHASGRIKSDLSAYDFNLLGDRIDVPRLKRELAPKIPALSDALAMIDPYRGQARLNLTISTGLRMNGRLDVNSLAMRTAHEENPIHVPNLSLLFSDRQVTLPGSTLYYGPMALSLSGLYHQPDQYRFDLASNHVPVDFVRENQALIKSLAGVDLPEIWNAAGSLSVNGRVENQGTQLSMNFQNAGLSWDGGDFPLYDLNGTLNFQQRGKAVPTVASRNLNFRYGNSPVSVSLDNHGQLNAVAEGVLSPLTVNHFLVSRQSEATPYREIPFQASATGVLAAIPGPSTRGAVRRNDIRTYLHFNLDPNFQGGGNTVQAAPTETVATEPTSNTSGENGTAKGNASNGSNGSSVSLMHPVRSVGHVLSTARQAVQSSLDILIGSTPAGAGVLPAFGKPASQPLVQTSSAQPQIKSQSQAVSESPTPANPSPVFVPGEPGKAYLNASLHLQGTDLRLDQALLHLFDAGDLVADGMVEQILDPSRRVFLLRLATNPGIDLSKIGQGAEHNVFFKDAKGQVGMNVQFAGATDGSKVAVGWINAKQVAIPYLTVQDVTGHVNLDGETAQVVVEKFQVPGVSASATGRTENIFEMPVTLEDVKIHGDLLSIDSLGEFNNQIVKPILVDQVARNYARPWQQGDPTIPIQFRNAALVVDEAIFQNIIMNNMTSQFSLYPNSFFELSNTSLQAAGGVARGYLSMSPNDSNFMTLELNVDSVKANALTKALLNVTNQIFGDVNGTVRFTTFGDTDIGMQQNANGTVSMRVLNGRLPAIAKVETLLTTANVIRGGLLGLNLNNLLRTLTFYDTNYFATLSGDMLINNQVLYTRNLTSNGVNLNLLIRGSLRMDNGNANMVVDGTMRQVVAGRLGALGRLSLGGLVSYIPALGTLGKNRTGLLGYIPGVGWVPGFGGPAGDVNRFRVRLVGDLNTPGAIQDFHWMNNQSAPRRPQSTSGNVQTGNVKKH